jgi:signal transduction histidine kinase/tetratricopeptide (TPR) repeat protein
MSAAALLPPLAWPVSLDDAALTRLQALPIAGSPAAVAAHHTALAWHLRQRDTARALAQADAAERLLEPQDHALHARLQLVRAEARWLAADLSGCEALARQAHAGFAAAQDLIGQSDVMVLQAHAVFDVGEYALARQHMQQALALAQAAADRGRAQAAGAVLALWSTMGDADQAELDWGPAMAELEHAGDPHVALWACDFFGQLHTRRGRHSQAIRAFSAAFAHARQSGHVRRAVLACTNVAANYSNLNANDSALEWLEQALQLARPTGWPASVGVCLMAIGNELSQLHRLDAARAALDEALQVMQPLPGARLLLLAQYYMAGVMLEQGDARAAAELAVQTFAAARRAGMAALESDLQCTLAKALLRLGLRSEAIAAAELALQLAERDSSPSLQFLALRVLADVHAPIVAAQTAPASGPRASLPHLQRALALGSRIEEFIPDPEIFDAVAREHAHLGDDAQAYAFAVRANAAHDQGQARTATRRAAALEVRAELARARAQAQALREQAAAEARRAALLQEANGTLQQLGSLGREITAQFEMDQVFERLYMHLQSLLDLQHLSIWLLAEPGGGDLHLRFGLEHGQRLVPLSVALDDDSSHAARCVRQAQELLHASPLDAADPSPMPGTLRTLTALFGPLQVRGRIIGALSIQSVRTDAYGERERLVFRTACAWAAIALDNGAVVAQLQSARRQLQLASDAERDAREQAELATQLKGEFLSNISHDLRTPLASLQGYLETLLLEPGAVSDADRARYLDAALAQSAKVNHLAAELSDLAQLESGAMQPALARFSLADLLFGVVRKLELAVSGRSQRLLLHLPRELPDALADAGMIERVLTNLLDNAVQHAPQGSQIRVEICTDTRVECRQLRVTVLDTGPGIPVELRAGLFSRPSPVAQAHRPGGGGLGLLIVQRLLQQHGCEIRLVQRAGYGAAFSFGVPCVQRGR